MNLDAFKRKMAERPEVQQCFYVAGEHDFVLVVTATTSLSSVLLPVTGARLL